MAKGIRVNQLAKELGVASKLILDKCKAEGLSDQVPNHMSVLSVGLSETVREWFVGGIGDGGGTAVETAAPVDTLVKPKLRKPKKKDDLATADAPNVDGPHLVEAPAVPEPPLPEIVAEAPPAAAPVAKAPAAPTDEAQPDPSVSESVAPTAPVVPETDLAEAAAPAGPLHPVAAPASSPAGGIAPPPAAPLASAATAPGSTVPGAPASGAPRPAAPGAAPAEHMRSAPMRPTVTLQSRATAPPAERKVVKPAPQMVKPTPAQISGPKIVRIEKEETVDTRQTRGPRPTGDAPSFAPAAPRGGRGVKVTEEEDEDARKKALANKKGASLSSRRRGVDGRRGEAMEKLKEFTDADLIERRDRLNAAASYTKGVADHLRKTGQRGTHAFAKTTVQKGEPVQIEEPITVRTLSAALGVKSNEIISKLIKQGIFATLNQSLDADAAGAMALEYGLELQIVKQATDEERFLAELENVEPVAERMISRPPVVTILGHVDHGKTSLLDKIRNAHVAAGEAGGITQHTAAWMVTIGQGENAKRVTFIDTPGHRAFTNMRARGANMTDVVVLVVSAAEGVQPQTIESINHARAAGVPIVVAMNKIDRPDANPEMVLGQLAANGLNAIEWGGDTEVVRTSAITGQGINDLIEILDLQSQILELKTDPGLPARGTVIESRIDEGLGSVATVLIQDGVLKVGDIGLCGGGWGRIRSLLNDRLQMIDSAGASTPVLVSGLSVLPSAGEKFFVVADAERARTIAEERSQSTRQSHLSNRTAVTAENLMATMRAGQVSTINLIIKGDVQGSVETLVKTVTESNTDEVKVHVIHSGVGPINESDVDLAVATRAGFADRSKDKVAIIGFHVVPEDPARVLAEQNRIDVKTYRVIYEIFDDLKKALSGMLTPEIREKMHGHAEVRQVFKVSRIGNIAGCMVTDGHIQRGSKIRLIRNGTIVTEDLSLESLKRVKDDVREVKSGLECGIKIAGYDDIKVGDVFEAYVREEFERTL